MQYNLKMWRANNIFAGWKYKLKSVDEEHP